MIGWKGPELVVLAKLQRAGADRGDDGRYIISGAPVRYTLKDGVLHVAVPVDAVFFVRGQRRSFAAILEGVPSVNPLLDKASNDFGPLDAKQKQSIMDYLATPTEAGWESIAHMIVAPGSLRHATIWQWVGQVDPSFPRRKTSSGRWPRIPDPMTVARAIKAAAASRDAASNPGERAAEMAKLQQRIAEKLRWSLADVQSMSLPSLREVVRPVSPKLADELTQQIAAGAIARNPGKGELGHCNGTSYDASISLKSGGRIARGLHEKVYDAIQKQPEIECVTTEVQGHGTRIEVSARLERKHASKGLPALERAVARAVAAVSSDLHVTDLGHLVTLGIDRSWVVAGEDDRKPISFVRYAEDALDGEDGSDTRRVLEMMRAQGFPQTSPARIPMGSCDGKTQVIEIHRSRGDWYTRPRVSGKRARTNPMATAQEMLDAIYAWLVQEELTFGVSFKSPEKWRELGWDKELGLPEVTEGFVVMAEGTSFNHALAGWMDHDRREEKKIYDGWNKLLEDHGWGWQAKTGWAFHVYPREAKMHTDAPAPATTTRRTTRAAHTAAPAPATTTRRKGRARA